MPKGWACSVYSRQNLFTEVSISDSLWRKWLDSSTGKSSVHISDASVGAISNYLMFESNHFLDLANQSFFSPFKGKIPSFYFLLHN